MEGSHESDADVTPLRFEALGILSVWDSIVSHWTPSPTALHGAIKMPHTDTFLRRQLFIPPHSIFLAWDANPVRSRRIQSPSGNLS